MIFTINQISRCAGNNHIIIGYTADGAAGELIIGAAELQLEPDNGLGDLLSRIRSAVKETNAITPTQIKTALLNKTFKL